MDVLILDDEAIIRNGLKKYLASLNYGFRNILTAGNAKEAFALLEEYSPSLILADVVMPGLDGIRFCTKLREKNKDLQFIIISGHSDMEYIKTAFKISVCDYLFKPVDFQELSDSIRKAVLRIQGSSRPARAQELPRKSYYSKYTQMALDFIEENYYKAISVQVVADFLKITPNYLSSTFKQDTNMGFSDFLTEYRMKKASRLLGDPLLKISEISQIVGYEDQNYFARAFKKQFGYTPSEYRQSMVRRI